MSEFKYVPVEPTEEMLTAAYLSTGNKYYWTRSYFIEGYKAALAAAPTQPSPAESDKEAVRNAALEEAGQQVDGATINQRILAKRIRRLKSQPAQPIPPQLKVWYGSMPESNGKTNWTAMLYRDGGGKFDAMDGFTIARSEYPDRVRYDADCVRHLIGEVPEKPFILDYDGDKCDAPELPAQPSDTEIQDALYDSAYMAGLGAGWNFGLSNDSDGYSKCVESRRGYLKSISEKRKAIKAAMQADREGS